MDYDLAMAVPVLSPRAQRTQQLLSALVKANDVIPKLDCNYLVKNWLEREALSVVYGESNVGKTFFALDLAFHVAAGGVWQRNRVVPGKGTPCG